MPYRRRGSFMQRRGSSLGRMINSRKNVVSAFTGLNAGTDGTLAIATAQDNPTLAVTNDVAFGCVIKAIWVEFWCYATQDIGEGVTTGLDAYIIKNPGTNLTNPTPGTIGSSNEKKFIFRTWKGLIGQRTDGSPPYNFRGWIKIPKRYQRMGANDLFSFVFRSTGTNIIMCTNFIYKWYT